VAVLKSTVLDQLGVDATITRVVDVLPRSVHALVDIIWGTYLMQETISVWMSKLAGDITT
jgi:hypothetical protein